jgi:hypothetical protein
LTLIDGDKLKAYIDQINSFATKRSHEIRADGEDPSYFDGIRQYADKMIAALKDGQFEPNTKKTPIEKIETPVKNKVRPQDPSTSWSAAIAQTPAKSFGMYMAIKAAFALKPAGLTDEDLILILESNHMGFSESGVRSRRAELRDAGWIKDSGEKGFNLRGNKSIIWKWVED